MKPAAPTTPPFVDSAAPTLILPPVVASSAQENFSVLSPLVPKDLRPHFASVYDYCRLIDDLADAQGVGESARHRALALLELARQELRLASDNKSHHPIFQKLGVTIREKSLPIGPFEDLILAFEQDQRITRYETWDQLLDYCTRSANPVGRIILMLDGHVPDREPELFHLSDRICTALQLTNFWQDVRRDMVERDRIYLPLRDFKHSEAELRDWMNRPRDPDARLPYILALRQLVERTDLLYVEGGELIGHLNRRLGPVVYLFHRGGHETLRMILRTGCTTLWQRPRLSKIDKAALVLRALVLRSLRRWGR
ncbi:MAG: squalene synthase HpnC [Phycisphaeraceae bacterium]|nr:squalene synthase HpnC [Phycisphaeraceae bacterium]